MSTPAAEPTLPRRLGGRGISGAREGLLALLAGLVLAWLLRTPGELSTTIPGDLGDPLLVAWILAWGGHALTSQPGSPFDANAFAPLERSLAFSDSMLGYAPLSILGEGPADALVRYNLIYLLAYALAFAGCYVLARQLGCGRWASLVAALAFAFSPWRLSQSGHLQVLSSGAIPLALAALARGHGIRLRARHPDAPVRPGWILLGWTVAAWQISLGFGLGLQTAYLLAALTALQLGWWAHSFRRTRTLPPRSVLLAQSVGVAGFLAISAAFALPYLQVVEDHPQAERSVETVALFSPLPASFLAAPPTSAFWGELTAERLAAQPFAPENALFPGLTVILLALLGLGSRRWSRSRRLGLEGGVVVLCILALGTNGPFGGGLYILLLEHAPGWSGVRTPGRLVTTAWLLLALLAAAGLDTLRDLLATRARTSSPLAALVNRRRRIAATLLSLAALLAVLGESRSTLAHPTPPSPPSLELAALPQPVMVLPSDDGRDPTVMWWSTDGFPELVNGTSGFVPQRLASLREISVRLPDPQALAELREAGVGSLVIPHILAGEPYATSIAQTLQAQGAEVALLEDAAVISLR